MSVYSACTSGDRRTSLVAIRDALAQALDVCPPAAKAQTAAQLRAVLEELASLPDTKENAVDDLVARRKERRAATDSQLRPKKRRRTEHRT